ncbi:MAG: aminotransferase class III-fold pyridoxal phosphate-dependent enzyme [Candidatus Calescibacterium sp.]|nr:aminotransferase class III-fold pyridoxal phosphate-dependent enzyme [Candidatus Calescibacterium sp.]
MSLDDLFLNTYQRFDFVVDKALGSYIYSSGKKYLDMISGIGVNSLGHLDRDVVSGIRKQLSKHLHLSNLFWQEVQINFAREFLKTIDGKYRIFLSNSGAEATECALKISKLPYQGKRKKTLCFVGAFHGRTYGALSATYKEEFKKPFEPLLEGFKFVPFGDIESVRSELASREYAMVLLEPIQGEGGVITPPKDFIKELRKVCDETDTILVVDEIQTGVGKTGKFWCYEWEEIKPDVLLSSKAIGGGIPLGVTAFSEKLADFVKPGMHASTFGGNPLACAAGQVVIRKIRNKKFLRSVVQKGEYLKRQIQNMGFDVQGRGLMIGIIVDSSGKTEPKSINEFFIKRGIVINSMRTYKGDTRIRILPPLSIQKKDLDFFLNVLEDFKKSL